jgi:hypothetical protein
MTEDKFTARSLKEQTVQLVINWINLGYSRESCIRMTIAEGFGENYAVSVVDRAFDRISEGYNQNA